MKALVKVNSFILESAMIANVLPAGHPLLRQAIHLDEREPPQVAWSFLLSVATTEEPIAWCLTC